jgi:hypothetical protein
MEPSTINLLQEQQAFPLFHELHCLRLLNGYRLTVRTGCTAGRPRDDGLSNPRLRLQQGDAQQLEYLRYMGTDLRVERHGETFVTIEW